MQFPWKIIYNIWTVIIIPVYLGIIILYGWDAYATLTERGGLSGNMHEYYNLSMTQYAVYKSVISLVAFILCILHLRHLNNERLLIKLIWAFVIFIITLILCESVLMQLFVGKG